MSAVMRARTAWQSGPLGSRDFRLLTAGQLTSTIGDYCFVVGLPWLVLSGPGGVVHLGIVTACYGVSRAALLMTGGTLADRIGSRLAMLGTDLSRLALLGGLALASAAHADSLPVLCPLAALLGAGSGLFVPASMSVMPALLSPGQLPAGNSLFSAATQTGTFIGPVLGGAVVAAASPSPAFLIDAATFAVSAATLTLMSRRPAPSAASLPEPATSARPPGAGIWALLRGWPVLRLILAQITVATLAFGGTFEVALPALAHLRFGAAAYGALLAAIGIGAMLGTLAAARTRSLTRPMLAASTAFLGQAVAISIVPYLGGLPGALTATLAYGACNGFGNVVFLTALQRAAPRHLLGRVMSLIMLANWGTLPLSVILAGIAVHQIGPSPFFPLAGITLAVPLLAVLTQCDYRSFDARSGPPPPH